MARLRLAFAVGLVLLLGACNNEALQKPVITSFTAQPSALPPGGGSTTLNWEVEGAQTLAIDQGVGAVTGTSKKVSVTATTTFTLTAANLLGNATRQVTVTVDATNLGPSLLLAPKTATLTAGGTKATFTATLKNATGEIAWKLSPELGTLSAKTGASVDYTPPATVDQDTTLTLTATSGSLSDSATLILKPSSVSGGITVSGRVSDIAGVALANIPVRIVDAGGPKDLVNTDASGNFRVSGVKTPYSVSAAPPLATGSPATWEGVTRPDPKLVLRPPFRPPTCPVHTLSGSISPPVGAGNRATVAFVAPGITLAPLTSYVSQFLDANANSYTLSVDLAANPAPRCQEAYTGSLIYLERDGTGAVVRTAFLRNISSSAGNVKLQDLTPAPTPFTTLSGRVGLPSNLGASGDTASVSALLKLGPVSYPLGLEAKVGAGAPSYNLSVPLLEGAQYRVEAVYNYGPQAASFAYSEVLEAGGSADLTLPELGQALTPSGAASSLFPTFEQAPVAGSNLYQVYLTSAPMLGSHDTEWNGYSSGPTAKLPDLPAPARLASGKGYQWVISNYQLRGIGINDLLDGRLVLGDFSETNPDTVAAGFYNRKSRVSFTAP